MLHAAEVDEHLSVAADRKGFDAGWVKQMFAAGLGVINTACVHSGYY